jgi:ATP-dependent Clp protease adaptor protein ClpS
MTPTPNNQPVNPTPAVTNPRYRDSLAQWHVVLINDADHSYNYITTLLREVFKLPVAKTVELASSMSKTGRAVCMTTHKEYAEFKRDQILAFGKDTLVEGCPGSMIAVVEQA